MELLILFGVMFAAVVFYRFCKWCGRVTPHQSFEHGKDETLRCEDCGHQHTFRTK